MSEATYTNGPWVYNKGGQVLGADKRLIASAWFPEQVPDTEEERKLGESWLEASTRLRPEVDRIYAQMDKHGRLIAAAPDQHEANKTSLLVLCALLDACVWHQNMRKDIEFAIEANRAAIAKATGTQ